MLFLVHRFLLEELRSPKSPVLTKATWRHIPEDCILQDKVTSGLKVATDSECLKQNKNN
jgi:hypothetical protein